MDPDLQGMLGLPTRLEGGGQTDNSDQDPSYRYQPLRSRSFANHSARSYTSSIPPSAKQELTKASPAGEQCIITQRKSHVEYSHIVAQSTKSADIKQLEFCWGLKPGTLKLDVPYNMVWLSPEMHTCFDRNHWALVPPLKLLQKVQQKTIDDFSNDVPQLYTKWLPLRVREYSYVQLKAGEEPIPRYDADAPGGAILHQSPFTTLPPIHSHIHPYFVIVNVAKKDLKHCPKPKPEPEPDPEPKLDANTDADADADLELKGELELDGYETLAGNAGFLQRVRLCRKIYQLWMNRRITSDNLPLVGSQTTQTSRSNVSSNGSSTSRRTRRSANDLSGSKGNNPELQGRGKEPGQHNQAQSSALADSDSVSAESWSVDEFDIYQVRGEYTAPYHLKVRNWLRDMENSFTTDHSQGRSVRRHIEDGKH